MSRRCSWVGVVCVSVACVDVVVYMSLWELSVFVACVLEVLLGRYCVSFRGCMQECVGIPSSVVACMSLLLLPVFVACVLEVLLGR